MTKLLGVKPLYQQAGGIAGVRLAGKGLSEHLSARVLGGSLKASTTEVTELSLTIQDTLDSALHRRGLVRKGSVLTMSGWTMAVTGWTLQPGDAGPTLEITAPSRYVERLRAQTGAKSWGTQDISGWVRARAREVKMNAIVQPNLGRQLFIRDKPKGDQRPSTWDLMVEGAEVGGAWLFEYGPNLILARPSWLARAAWGGRMWRYTWNGWESISSGLAAMPQWSYTGGEQSMDLSVIAHDRWAIRPGDKLGLNGRAVTGTPVSGIWLVESVEIPLDLESPAEVHCVRPVDPDKADPRTPEAKANPSRSGSGGGARGGASKTKSKPAPVSSSGSSRIVAWANRVKGGSYDFDGGYGAQCVDLAKKYNAEVIRGAAFRGNGKDNARNAVRAGSYTWVGPRSRARIGDIVSWDGSWGGGYGHVGVVLQDRGSSLYCVHQNYGRTKISAVSKRGVVGYARPRRLP